MMQSLACRI